MKTENQILHFLSASKIKSETDWDFISAYCKTNLKIKLSEFIKPSYNDSGISPLDFSEWLNNGYGDGDVVVYKNGYAILGKCTMDDAKIEAIMVDGQITIKRTSAKVSVLSKATEKETQQFMSALYNSGFQYAEDNMLVIERFVPSINDKVDFKNDKIHGIGVIRSIDTEKNILEFYCYYIYGSGEIGYSMHETLGGPDEYVFNPLTIGGRRRLERELNTKGKTWKDKIRRIEPLNYRVEAGKPYWYISDKFKACKAIEKYSAVSNQRFLVGNYYTSLGECLDDIAIFAENRRNALAKPENDPSN